MKDLLLFLEDPQYNPPEGLGTEENFKKFHMVMDHSDHPFSEESSPSQQKSYEDPMVMIGDVALGIDHLIRIQRMTTTTKDVVATVEHTSVVQQKSSSMQPIQALKRRGRLRKPIMAYPS